MRLSLATIEAVRYSCVNFHYAKSVPVKSIAFNVFNNKEEWCGTIVYGLGANAQIAEPYNKWQGQVIELVRVALNGKQEKTSQAVGISLRLLKKYCPMVDLVVSYADIDQNHKGIIYKATNFIYEGKKTEGAKTSYTIKGKRMHNRSIQSKGWKANLLWLREHIDISAKENITKGKHKYLYCFDEKLKERLKLIQQEFPK